MAVYKINESVDNTKVKVFRDSEYGIGSTRHSGRPQSILLKLRSDGKVNIYESEVDHDELIGRSDPDKASIVRKINSWVDKTKSKYGWDPEVTINDNDIDKALQFFSDKYSDRLTNESLAEEVKEESTKVEEAVTNDYRVVGVIMDVAMPANKSLDDYGTDGSTSGKLYHAISGALKSVGLEMAGDYVDVAGDHTDVYKDNDYEFEFEESLKEDITDSSIEDIDEFVAEVKERFPGSEVIFDGDTNTIKITLDNKEEESLTENAVSNFFSPALDAFLQDMAQMFGKITYTDIMNSRPDKKDLGRLNQLRREYNKEAQYESPDNEEIFKQIASEVADIVKRNKKKEEESLKESYYDKDILDMAQTSFETGHWFDRDDFESDDEFEEYTELMDMGPAGFLDEFEDELDFDPDFVDEYGYKD